MENYLVHLDMCANRSTKNTYYILPFGCCALCATFDFFPYFKLPPRHRLATASFSGEPGRAGRQAHRYIDMMMYKAMDYHVGTYTPLG